MHWTTKEFGVLSQWQCFSLSGSAVEPSVLWMPVVRFLGKNRKGLRFVVQGRNVWGDAFAVCVVYVCSCLAECNSLVKKRLLVFRLIIPVVFMYIKRRGWGPSKNTTVLVLCFIADCDYMFRPCSAIFRPQCHTQRIKYTQ
jgi:hypothetical protein